MLMPAEWLDVLEEDVLSRFAIVEGYSLTIVGGEGWWPWFVDLNGHRGTEGLAHDIETAVVIAEDTAHRLARGAEAEDKD